MIVLVSLLDSIAKGISLFPGFFALCMHPIPTSLLNDFALVRVVVTFGPVFEHIQCMACLRVGHSNMLHVQLLNTD